MGVRVPSSAIFSNNGNIMKLKRIHIAEPLRSKLKISQEDIRQIPVKYISYEPHDLSKARKLKKLVPFSERYNQVVTVLLEAMQKLTI